MKKHLLILFVIMFLFSGSSFGQTTTKKDIKDIEYHALYRWWIDISNIKEISITEKESQLMDAEYKMAMTKIIEWKLESKKAILDLEIESSKKNFDGPKCLKLFKKIQNLRTEMAVERFRYSMELRKIVGDQRFMIMVNKFNALPENIKRHFRVGQNKSKD